MEAEESSARTLQETAALVRGVYKATWQDFYTWENDHCRQTLLSLARNIPRSTGIEASGFSGRDSSAAATNTEKTTEDDGFTVHDYSSDTPKVSSLFVETVHVTPPFKACPPYEICTPASRNIYVGDDFEEMPFIQLADDPTFNHLLHTADYARFEWQLSNRDPDCKSCYDSSYVHPPASHKTSAFLSGSYRNANGLYIAR
jgi:histone-lysine N-methyltransferase EZH2